MSANYAEACTSDIGAMRYLLEFETDGEIRNRLKSVIDTLESLPMDGPAATLSRLVTDLVETVEDYEGSDEDGPSIDAPALRAVLEAARAIADRHDVKTDPIDAAVDTQQAQDGDEVKAFAHKLAKGLPAEKGGE